MAPRWLAAVHACIAQTCSSLLGQEVIHAPSDTDWCAATLPVLSAGLGQRRAWRLAVMMTLVNEDAPQSSSHAQQVLRSSSKKSNNNSLRAWRWTSEALLLALACLRDELCCLDAAAVRCAGAGAGVDAHRMSWYAEASPGAPSSAQLARAVAGAVVSGRVFCGGADALSVALESPTADAVEAWGQQWALRSQSSFDVPTETVRFLCVSAKVQRQRALAWAAAVGLRNGNTDVHVQHRRATLKMYVSISEHKKICFLCLCRKSGL